MLLEHVDAEKVLLCNILEMVKKNEKKIIEQATGVNYKYGFVSNFESDTIKKGLSESVIKTISAKKNEPDWMLTKRLEAFEIFKKMTPPKWAN